MKKEKEYKLKIKRAGWFEALKKLICFFKKKPTIINLNEEELNPQAIYVANHSGASGPMTFEGQFPVRITAWGAHPMCEGFKSRWNYLYHVFYRQKLHYSKFKSFLIATIFAPFSIILYRAVGLIPTYQDKRLLKTFRCSTKVLDANSSLLIFPEDSTNGYFEPPIALNKGYIAMAKAYYRHKKVDLPIYTVYYSKKKALFVIGEPLYINDLLSKGYTEDEINQTFLNKMNELHDTYVEKDAAVKEVAAAE